MPRTKTLLLLQPPPLLPLPPPALLLTWPLLLLLLLLVLLLLLLLVTGVAAAIAAITFCYFFWQFLPQVLPWLFQFIVRFYESTVIKNFLNICLKMSWDTIVSVEWFLRDGKPRYCDLILSRVILVIGYWDTFSGHVAIYLCLVPRLRMCGTIPRTLKTQRYVFHVSQKHSRN